MLLGKNFALYAFLSIKEYKKLSVGQKPGHLTDSTGEKTNKWRVSYYNFPLSEHILVKPTNYLTHYVKYFRVET